MKSPVISHHTLFSHNEIFCNALLHFDAIRSIELGCVGVLSVNLGVFNEKKILQLLFVEIKQPVRCGSNKPK